MTRPAATRGWELHREIDRASEGGRRPPKAIARLLGCGVATVLLHAGWKCACDPANPNLTNVQRER